MNSIIENVIATIIVTVMSTATGFALQATGLSSQQSIVAATVVLCALVIVFLAARRCYPVVSRRVTERLLENALRVRGDEVDKDKTIFKNRLIERVLLENPSVESHLNTSIVEFPSQHACESHIQDASRTARRVRILTIRGEKYFVGSKSLLHHLCSSKRTNTRILVLSPDAQHLTPELAIHLEHESAEEIKEKMHHALQILKFHARKNKNFEVKCYEGTPNFKLLVFDDVMFVSSFAGGGPKNDQHAKMYQIKREGNSLFLGLERQFDELWNCSICAK